MGCAAGTESLALIPHGTLSQFNSGQLHLVNCMTPGPYGAMPPRPVALRHRYYDELFSTGEGVYDFTGAGLVKSGFGGEHIDSNHRLM